MIIMIHSGGFDLRKEKEIDKVRKLLNNVTSTGATDIELASGLNNLHSTITSEITTAKNQAITNSNTHSDKKAEEILNAVVNILALG